MDAVSGADEVCSIREPLSSMVKPTHATLIRVKEHTESIINITANGSNHPPTYIGTCGASITVKFQTAIVYIISMAIPSITLSKTWRSSKDQTIAINTQTNGLLLKKIVQNKPYIWIKSDLKHQNGINQLKDGNGIRNIVSCLKNKLKSSNVSSAEKGSLWKQLGIMLNIAQFPVKRNVRNTRNFVSSVASHLRTVIVKGSDRPVLEYVPVLSALKRVGTVPVYNLSVDEIPEFFANGFLVHNCDAVSGAFTIVTRGRPQGFVSFGVVGDK